MNRVRDPNQLRKTLDNVVETLNGIVKDLSTNPRYAHLPSWILEDLVAVHGWVDDEVEYNFVEEGEYERVDTPGA
jgi:hypothetical protein